MAPLIIAALLFLFIGAVCTILPRAVQRFALLVYARMRPRAIFAPLQKRMERELYIWQLRLIGVICLFTGLLCVWLVLFAHRQ